MFYCCCSFVLILCYFKKDGWNLVFDEDRKILHLILLVIFSSELWTAVYLFKKYVATAICWMKCETYLDNRDILNNQLSVLSFQLLLASWRKDFAFTV